MFLCYRIMLGILLYCVVLMNFDGLEVKCGKKRVVVFGLNFGSMQNRPVVAIKIRFYKKYEGT